MPSLDPEFYVLREEVAQGLKDFERNMGRDEKRESELKLVQAVRRYEVRVPREVRFEIAGEKRDEVEVAFAARLRLEQYYNACFCDK